MKGNGETVALKIQVPAIGSSTDENISASVSTSSPRINLRCAAVGLTVKESMTNFREDSTQGNILSAS